jgi:hypothetical protein
MRWRTRLIRRDVGNVTNHRVLDLLRQGMHECYATCGDRPISFVHSATRSASFATGHRNRFGLANWPIYAVMYRRKNALNDAARN